MKKSDLEAVLRLVAVPGLTMVVKRKAEAVGFAAAVPFFVSAGFVLSLYVWEQRFKNRNEKSQLVRRCVSVVVYAAVLSLGFETHVMMRYTARVCFAIVALFLGPLFDFAADAVHRQMWIRGWQTHALILGRNYVIGPVAEEVVYRMVICSYLLQHGFTVTHVVLLSQTSFALAHIHHIVDHMRHQNTTVQGAVTLVVFQLGYTSVFGVLAALVFVHTHNIVACILMHCFCNVMGPPTFASLYSRYTLHRILGASAYLVGIALFYTCITPIMT